MTNLIMEWQKYNENRTSIGGAAMSYEQWLEEQVMHWRTCAESNNVPMWEIGKNLRMIRMLRGFTQPELAERLAVARTTVTAIETGNRRLKAEEILVAAEVLKCEVSHLLGTPLDLIHTSLSSEDYEQRRRAISLACEFASLDEYAILSKLVSMLPDFRYSKPALRALRCIAGNRRLNS